jgi:hypothetical protein
MTKRNPPPMWLTTNLKDSPDLPATAPSMRLADAIVLAQTIHHIIHREGQSHG